MRKLLFFILALASLQPINGGEIPKEILAGLVAEDFSVREKAEDNLYEWGAKNEKKGLESIAEAARASGDPEIRERSVSTLRRLSDEDYMSEGSGYLGINMNRGVIMVDEVKIAILVTKVEKGTPAEKAGLKAGDGILSLNGEAWKEVDATRVLHDEVKKMKPRDEIRMMIYRVGEDPFELKVILGRRPTDDLNMAEGRMAEFDELAREKYFEQWLRDRKLKIE